MRLSIGVASSPMTVVGAKRTARPHFAYRGERFRATSVTSR